MDNIYPYQYSHDVVFAFREKNARALQNLEYLLNIPQREIVRHLVRLFRFDNHKWNRAKAIIKYLQYEEPIDLKPYKGDDKSLYFTYVKYYMDEIFVDSGKWDGK